MIVVRNNNRDLFHIPFVKSIHKYMGWVVDESLFTITIDASDIGLKIDKKVPLVEIMSLHSMFYNISPVWPGGYGNVWDDDTYCYVEASLEGFSKSESKYYQETMKQIREGYDDKPESD